MEWYTKLSTGPQCLIVAALLLAFGFSLITLYEWFTSKHSVEKKVLELEIQRLKTQSKKGE